MELLDIVLNCCSEKPKFKIVYDCSPNLDETINVCDMCFKKPHYSNKNRIKQIEEVEEN